jgi:hypothetical protein
MPTAIQKIQAKAKALRKSYPNAKWTDLIKKASTDLKKIGAIGGVSKKKKATKKAATKKTVAKRKPKIVKVLKQHGTSAKLYDKRHQALPAGRRISKGGKPYTETRSNRSDKGVLLGVRKPMHKDTKSHNVNIRVVSGLENLNYLFIKEIQKINEEIEREQRILNTYLSLSKEKHYSLRERKNILKAIEQTKRFIKEKKTHLREIKKQIK